MERTSTGMQENVASLLCYLAGWVTGIIFLLIEKENRTVRFHAMQSIVVFGALMVLQIILGMIPVIGWGLMVVVNVCALVLWIVLMIKAYQGQMLRIPVAADIADKNI